MPGAISIMMLNFCKLYEVGDLFNANPRYAPARDRPLGPTRLPSRAPPAGLSPRTGARCGEIEAKVEGDRVWRRVRAVLSLTGQQMTDHLECVLPGFTARGGRTSCEARRERERLRTLFAGCVPRSSSRGGHRSTRRRRTRAPAGPRPQSLRARPIVAESGQKADGRQQNGQRRTLRLVLREAEEIDEERDEDLAAADSEESAYDAGQEAGNSEAHGSRSSCRLEARSTCLFVH
jgi:hypothetical protein